MHPSRVPIDPELLRRLYVDEGLSTPEIAAKLGCADVTILRRLRRLGIDVRPRGPVPVSRAEAIGIDWSPKLCYALGLMATDGNLSRRKGQMSLVSKDLEQIETLRRCLQLVARISRVRSSTGVLHKVQWCDRGLYNWFLGVGLTPAKSLTLGPLAVPDEHFADFFRGCVDGDGCVLVYTDRYHTTKSRQYIYERLYVSLVSASRPFLEWIQASIRRLAGVFGAIHTHGGKRRRPIWALRYAKAESIRLLCWMYYAPDVPCLARKRDKAERFLSPLGYASVRSVGRPRVGWLYTVGPGGTVEDRGRSGVTAATLDSKSSARKGVRVRIPPPAPFLDNIPRTPVG